MLMRMLAAAGIVALLGGCAGAPPPELPPVRDGSLPGAAAPAARPDPIAVERPSGIDRSAPRPVNAPARSGIPRPRPAAARPARHDEGRTGAAATSREEAAAAASGAAAKARETPNGKSMEDMQGAGAKTVGTFGTILAEPALPEDDTRRQGNAAIAALLDSAREAEKARRYGRAAAALERALKVEPRNPWLWHRLAAIRHRQGRHPEAEALSRRSLSLSPGDVKLASRNWRVIAAARHGQGDEEGAREALGRANAP